MKFLHDADFGLFGIRLNISPDALLDKTFFSTIKVCMYPTITLGDSFVNPCIIFLGLNIQSMSATA